MTYLALKMTEKFTGCQEYQPRSELSVFRKKKEDIFHRGFISMFFFWQCKKNASIISTWTLTAVLYLFDLSKSTED